MSSSFINEPEPGILVIPLFNKPPIKIRESEWPIIAKKEGLHTSATAAYSVIVRQNSLSMVEMPEHLVYAMTTWKEDGVRYSDRNNIVFRAYLTNAIQGESYLEAISKVCESLKCTPVEVLSSLPIEDRTTGDRKWVWSTPDGNVYLTVNRRNLPEDFEGRLKGLFPEIQNTSRPPIDKSALARVAAED